MFSVKSRLTWVSVLTLVLSAFVPLQTAPATAVDSTFTKTVTVVGVDGQPYVGAQVALIYTNHTTQTWVPTTPVTTGPDGVAIISASSSNRYLALSVEPPVTDTATATWTSRIGAVSNTTQALNIQLVASNMRVNVLSPGGSDAPAGSYAAPPSDQVDGANKHTITVRSGSFGLAVSTIVTGQQELWAGAASDIDASNRIFALQMSGTGTGATRVLYSDDTFTSSTLNPVSGVYQLQLRSEDIHGVLRNSADTSNVTIPTGVQGRVVFTPANQDGSLNRWYQGPKSSPFNSDGTFVSGLPSLKPGKYFSQILIGGSATLPSFSGPALWVDGSGKYSMSQGGTFEPASTFIFRVLLPSTQPNLVVRSVSSTNTAQASYLDLDDENNQGNWWGPNATSNGIASYVLPSGTYWVRVSPFDSNEITSSMGYRINVDGNSIDMRDDHNMSVSATSTGNYTIATGRVNVRLQVNNPNGSGAGLANANVEVRPAGGNSIHGYSDSGSIAMSVPSGTYNLQVSGGTDGSFASKNYEMVVTSGGFNVSALGGSSIAPVSGYVPVTPNLATAKFKIMDPRANVPTVLNNAAVDLQAANGDWLDGSGTWDQPVGLYFDDGVYTVNVQGFNVSGLATATYSLTKAGSTITLRAPDGTVVQPVSPGMYEVFPSLPNLTFVVKHPANPNSTLNAGSVEIFNSTNNNWVARSEMNNGLASFSLGTGRYNVRVNPGGSASGLATSTYTLEMTGGVSTLKKPDGTTVSKTGNDYVVYPQSANVNLIVEHPTTHQTLSFAYVNVFMLDEARNSRDWVTNGDSRNGPIGLSVADGHYALQVNDGSGDTALASQRYELTVSNSGATVVLKTWSGTVINPTNGALIVSPQGANLLLRVVNPDAPTQPLRQSNVNIRDAATGEWLPGSGVNNLGQLGLNVDPGTYVMEVNPGQQASGLATKKYTLVVANDRSATLTPFGGGSALVKDATTSIFDVTVASANVKLNIVSPSAGHALLEQAWVNMFYAQGNNRADWVGNSNGSHPGFALANGNYIAEVNPGGSGEELASRMYKVNVNGATVTVTTMANVAVAAESNGAFNLEAATANLALTLVDPNDATLTLNQAYVNIFNRDNNNWVAGNGANRGLVSLNVAEGHYWIEVNPGSSGSALAPKKYNVDIDSSGNATVSGVSATSGRFILTAAAANLKMKIVDPTDSTKLITNSYVNLQRASDNEWVGNTGGNTGRLALRVEDGIYNLQVDPGQQAGGAVLARKTYTVTVSGNGASVAISGKTATDGVFTLEVATPAISGLVKSETDSSIVPNSWVVPTNTVTNEQLWQLGANSNSAGVFGIAVPDGAYSVTAQVPWNSGYNLAKSAPCSVSVSGGAVTTSAGGCVQSDKSLVLNLRAPNLTFIVADTNGNVLPNANVSIQFGNWNIWASANDAGRVSLFIDPAEIKAMNPTVSGAIHLNAYLDPPYGNTDVVRSQCTQGSNDAETICAQLHSITLPAQVNGSYTAYATQDLGTISLTPPNTRLTVTRPDNTTVGAGAWVTIYKQDANCSQCRNWVAGGNTSSAGRASFNVADTTGLFAVEVNAPNNERGTYATKTYTSLTWAQVNNQPFKLATPNLKVTVKQPIEDKLAKWSWLSVETLDGSNRPNGWIGGFGTSDLATASVLLPDNGNYRLTFYPGGGSAGARTTCDVSTNGSQVSLDVIDCTNGTLTGSDLVVTLSLGNFTGTVKHNGGLALAGAIVRAEWAGDGNNTQLPQTFTTAADGKYGFQLMPGAWLIKVFYVDDPDSGFTIEQEIAGRAVTVGNTNNPFDITLVG
jgi:hypothetical protein